VYEELLTPPRESGVLFYLPPIPMTTVMEAEPIHSPAEPEDGGDASPTDSRFELPSEAQRVNVTCERIGDVIMHQTDYQYALYAVREDGPATIGLVRMDLNEKTWRIIVQGSPRYLSTVESSPESVASDTREALHGYIEYVEAAKK
jgi:hypothetical protein